MINSDCLNIIDKLNNIFHVNPKDKNLYLKEFWKPLNTFYSSLISLRNKILNTNNDKINSYKRLIIKHKFSNTSLIEDDYYESMTFYTALRKDKRSFHEIFMEYFDENVLIIKIIRLDSFIIPKSFKFSSILFFLYSSFFLSAFTYNEDYILKDYEGYDSIELQIYDYFERASISATFLLYLMKITSLMTSIVNYIKIYKKNTTESKEEKEATSKDIIDYYTYRSIYYFVLILILGIIYSYFLIIFGNIFQKKRIKVIITFFATIGINLSLEGLICFFYTLLRKLSIKCESIILFNIGYIIDVLA